MALLWSVLETKPKVRMERAWKLVKRNLCVNENLSGFCGDIFVGVGMTTAHDILVVESVPVSVLRQEFI